MTEAREKKPDLGVVKTMTEERDKTIVAMLEEFVKLAKVGELSDIAVIAKVRGVPMTEFEWDSDNPLELLGSLELAKQEVAMEMLQAAEGDEDEDEED